jgi:nitroreductase
LITFSRFNEKEADVITTPFGLTVGQTTQALEASCRAPSLHNSQPWTFALFSDRIEIYIDQARTLPASDPDGREARLACGAALFNLRLALARHGVSTVISVSSGSAHGLVATLRAGGGFGLTPERANLERAIVHRRTNRQPYFDAEVPAGHRQTLERAAEAEQTTLRAVTDPAELAELGRWAHEAHRSQLEDPAWVTEWTKWTGRDHTFDGVPVSAAGPAPAPQDLWTLRDFGPPGRAERPTGRDFEERPLLAILCSYSDSPTVQIQVGQALERVLLQATSLGLAVSFVSQLIEVVSIRDRVRHLLGGQLHPQVVLRIGFGGPVPNTPRRHPLDCLARDAVPLP